MSEKVLFVDDETFVLESFRRNLRKFVKMETANSGEKGLELIATQGPFAVVVSDLRMPGMNGVQFLSRVKELSPETTRILLTGQADLEDAIAVINEGQIFRFLTKPCGPESLKAAITDGIEQYRLKQAEKQLLEQTLRGTIKLLVEILSSVNPEAFSRSVRIQKLTKGIANRLNYEKMWQAEVTALLSHIGCVTVPGYIVKKKYEGEELTEVEERMFYQHMQIGHKLLQHIPRLEEVAKAIIYQEKQFDGGGLPEDNVRGKQIPFLARVLKVASDYSAYLEKTGNPEKALEEIRAHKEWYDPEILAALEAEVLQVWEGFVVKSIPPDKVEVGMVLADNVYTKMGTLLIPKGHEISEVLKIRILNFAETDNLKGPIKVLA